MQQAWQLIECGEQGSGQTFGPNEKAKSKNAEPAEDEQSAMRYAEEG
jgi:hypothetical protein